MVAHPTSAARVSAFAYEKQWWHALEVIIELLPSLPPAAARQVVVDCHLAPGQ